jgi:hypothetical protein
MVARYAFAAIASAAVASAQSLLDSDYYTSTPSTPAFWTVTARYAEQVTESAYTWYSTVETDTYTDTRTIKDNVVPTASPYLVTTVRGYYESDLEIVAAYYTTGVVAESDLVPETTYDYSSTPTTTTTTTSIRYSMPVTMTAPASCPTQCTYPVFFDSLDIC